MTTHPRISSIDATRLVLGTWGLAGSHGVAGRPIGYGNVETGAAEEVIDAAWNAGIRWVDTAPSYGGGAGLGRLAAWQQRTGNSCQVVVKTGRPLVDGAPVCRLSPKSLDHEVRASAAAVGHPAAILIKDPPRRAFDDGRAFEAIAELERRYPGVPCGFASHELEACSRAPETNTPRIAQIEIHGLNWRIARRVAARLGASGWSVWAIQPLAYGFLAGRRASSFGSDDFRSRIPLGVQRSLELAAGAFLRTLRCFLGTAAPAELSEATLALAFCLSLPEIRNVVVGPKSVVQLRDAIEAERLTRTEDLKAAMIAFQAATEPLSAPRR